MRRYNRPMRARLIFSLCLVLVAAIAAPAQAQDNIDRVQVGVPGTVTSKFATSLSLKMTIPSGYTRDCCYDFVSGVWVGPDVHYSNNPNRTTQSRTNWEVSFVRSPKSLKAIATAAGWANYPQISARARKVPHVLGPGKLGTLKSYAVVTQQAAPASKAQAALVIDLGQRVKAIALYTVSDPVYDVDTSGNRLTVNGMDSSAWNRHAADLALNSVAIEGALPISKVKAKSAGKKVKGTVTDIAGHVVGQATVTLQRRKGSKWKDVRKGRTSLKGTFSLVANGKGKYRVSAKFGGASARSKTVKVR
jgi:hypothetical protein